MLDLKTIRDDPAAFDLALARRGLQALSPSILALDQRRREAQTGLQEAQQRRNSLSKEIGAARGRGQATEPLQAEVAGLKDRMAAFEAEEQAAASALEAMLSAIPNLPLADVPDGKGESDNVQVRRVGEPVQFDFAPKPHFELGEALGLMDFSRAARMSGARFVVLKGALARLERALAAFMLDIHTLQFGYTEVAPPVLVNDGAVYGTGQLPKFADDLFRTTDGRWLIPTAEVSLTNLVADEILDERELPLRFTAHTPCFRSEAGASGRDTRGMIRQHQFSKVEMVSITHPDASGEELERMTRAAETVLQRLGLAYRVLALCTGDMGFSSAKTYDLEVWLPAQNTYREISSCSTCTDFQARRMKARFRPTEGKGTRFVHTLNGSGLAVGRTMVAVLENGQQADGSVHLPPALVPYMGGLETITA